MLHDENFESLKQVVQKRKDKPMLKWLAFDKLFKTGKQGLTGLLMDKNENKYAFKISQHINYLAEHEFVIMSRLNDIQTFCPHFCRSFALLPCIVEPKPKPDTDPFEISSKYPIDRNLLLEEHINGYKLCRHIKTDKTPLHVLFSSIKQALAAVCIAQSECMFTHYDLHSDNIIMRKCDPDLVFLYISDSENSIAVPSYGYYSSIIDFGFSFIDTVQGEYLSSTLAHTECGFMCDRFDSMADAKVLLISIKEELKLYRKSKEVKKFSNIVENIFANVNVHWDCGWDDNDLEGASYIILDKVQKKSQVKSRMFQKYGDFCFDLMLSLIRLPLSSDTSSKNLQLSYDIFVKEFSKIENEIQSSVYNLYILKRIVDMAKDVEVLYSSDVDRKKAIDKFRLHVIEAIQNVSSCCSPKKVHYERLLCSLYSFAECANSALNKIISEKMKIKKSEYAKMPVNETLDILNILCVNIEDTYTYNNNTKIMILDSVNKTRKCVTLTQTQLKIITECPYFTRGIVLREMLEETDDKRETDVDKRYASEEDDDVDKRYASEEDDDVDKRYKQDVDKRYKQDESASEEDVDKRYKGEDKESVSEDDNHDIDNQPTKKHTDEDTAYLSEYYDDMQNDMEDEDDNAYLSD